MHEQRHWCRECVRLQRFLWLVCEPSDSASRVETKRHAGPLLEWAVVEVPKQILFEQPDVVVSGRLPQPNPDVGPSAPDEDDAVWNRERGFCRDWIAVGALKKRGDDMPVLGCRPEQDEVSHPNASDKFAIAATQGHFPPVSQGKSSLGRVEIIRALRRNHTDRLGGSNAPRISRSKPPHQPDNDDGGSQEEESRPARR